MIVALCLIGYYAIAVITACLDAYCDDGKTKNAMPSALFGLLWPVTIWVFVLAMIAFPIHCIAMKFGKLYKDESEKEEK